MARPRKRRAAGTGWTRRESNGTWTAAFPRADGGHFIRRGFDTRPAAEAWLDDLVAAQAAHVQVGSGREALGARIDAWATRAATERQWKAKTIADVQWKLGYVKPYLGKVALADVTPDAVDAMLTDLAQSLAPNTVRQIRNYLHQIFEDARNRRHLTYNPVLKPQSRKRPAQRAPQRLTRPQAARLLLAAEPSFYAAGWWLVLALGLRAGEVCGLRRGDIDLAAGTLTIAQEVTDLRGKAHIDTVKRDRPRTLPPPSPRASPRTWTR